MEEFKDINAEALKDLARRSLAASFSDKELMVTAREKDEFGITPGAFVTLKTHGELHGCIGRLDNFSPLWSKVPELAKAAAFEDNRFPPLRPDELNDTEIEITLLGEPVEVDSIDEIKIGRDGLIISQGMHRGLLLPQVAVEYGWDVETFLGQTCLKAGVDPDDWKLSGTKIYRFEGVVI